MSPDETTRSAAADQVLEVWLEEVFQGVEPPDLTPRILAASSEVAGRDESSSSDGPAPEPASHVLVSPRPRRTVSRSRPALGLWGAVVAVSLAAALAVLLWPRDPKAARHAEYGRRSAKRPSPGETTPGSSPQDSARANPPVRHRSALPSEPALPTLGASSSDKPPHAQPQQPMLQQSVPAPAVSVPSVPALPAEAVLATMERLLAQRWQVASLKPAPAAEDSVWCRRAFLRILGRIPTIDELNDFLADQSPSRRNRLVDRLLDDQAYADERAQYWATFWANVLVGRTGGTKQGSGDRDALLGYLRRAVRDNRPFDRIVYELMSAEGTSDRGAPSAAQFWLIHYTPDAIRITDWATRAFWGRSIGCMRCHDQINGPMRQDDFWSLNLVLRTADVRRGKSPRVVVRSQSGLPEVFFERPDGRLAMAVPRLPDGSAAPERLTRDLAALRRMVARQFAESPYVAEALVNRLWAHFLGFGFTRPVDDMLPPREISHPELLRFLASQVRAHDYDWQELARWIVLSEPFGRSSRVTPDNESDVPETGVPPYFTRYYARPLAPEAVYQSLMLVAHPSASRQEQVAARKQWLRHWTQSLETDDGGEHSLFRQGVQKSWQLMNDPLMQRATNSREKGFLQDVAASPLPPEQKIAHLFLAALARQPTAKERKVALALLEQHEDAPAEALEDIWWALLNSNEFLSDH